MPYVVGALLPKPRVEPDYDGPYFREDEIPDLIKVLKGKPVYLNHDIKQHRVGDIVNFFSLPHGEIAVVLYIYEHETTIIRDLESGRLNGLSIGFGYEEGPYGSILTLKPYEISLVQEGQIENTHIIAHGKKGEFQLNFWAIHSVLGVSREPPSEAHTRILSKVVLDTRKKMAAPSITVEDELVQLRAKVKEQEDQIKKRDKELIIARNAKEYEDIIDQLTPYFASDHEADISVLVNETKDVFLNGQRALLKCLCSRARERQENVKTIHQLEEDNKQGKLLKEQNEAQRKEPLQQPPPPPQQQQQQQQAAEVSKSRVVALDDDQQIKRQKPDTVDMVDIHSLLSGISQRAIQKVVLNSKQPPHAAAHALDTTMASDANIDYTSIESLKALASKKKAEIEIVKTTSE